MVKFLLDNGAKADVVDKYRRTALDYARQVGHSSIIMMLEAKINKGHQEDPNRLNIRKNSF